MTTLYWITVAIAGVVAYTACAGVAWRLLRPARFNPIGWAALFPVANIIFFALAHQDYGGESDEFKSLAVVGWPIALVFGGVALTLSALALPLRATFRLCAGQLNERSPR